MKNYLLTTALCLLTAINAFAYSGGNGTVNNPYLISSKADMEQLASNVNGGQTYAGIYFLLTRDLTGANDTITSVIGNSGSCYFSGIFDGDGYKVAVKISATGPYVGVFGHVKNGAIKNVGVAGSITRPSASSTCYVRGICGYASGCSISNCYNTGTVSSFSYYYSYSGGICGYVSTIDSRFQLYEKRNRMIITLS